MIYQNKSFGSASFHEILDALVYGVRFDVSAILSFLVFYFAFGLLPFPFVFTRIYQRVLNLIYYVFHFVFFSLEWCDIEYFRQSGRRMTIEVFGLKRDIGDQAFHLLGWYWWLTLGFSIWFILFLWKAPKYTGEIRLLREKKWAWNTLVLPLAILLSAVGIRGTFSTRPLAPGHAFRYSVPALGNVAASTSFVFIKSIQAYLEGQSLSRSKYFEENDPAYLKWIQPGDFKPQSPKRDNIVLIILESCSSEYLGFDKKTPGPSYSPFLDSLAKKSVVFPNHYANARRSINSLPGILASIPDWLGPPYIMSNYQSNSIFGLGHLLRQSGYETAFFHGAKNGSMGFDYFSRLVGFEKYYGVNEFKGHPEDYDQGAWGIFDEPFFQFTAKELASLKKPFGAVLYTVSSHAPYHMPKKYEGRFPKGTQEIHPVVAYSDFALQKFFEKISTEPWYKDTLFIFTADHTHFVETPEFNNLLGHYRVPLMFFHPSKKLTFPDVERVNQHLDILPTIADYLGLSLPVKLPFGRSLYGKSEGRALLMEGGTQILVKQNWGIAFNEDGPSRFFARNNSDGEASFSTGTAKSIRSSMIEELKATLQFFRNGLIDNSWYLKHD